MSESTSNDRRDVAESGENETDGHPVLRPADDRATVELVCDAIDVARGELSDRRFSRKYATRREESDGGDGDASES